MENKLVVARGDVRRGGGREMGDIGEGDEELTNFQIRNELGGWRYSLGI